MRLHLVKVKCHVIGTDSQGEQVTKKVSTAIALRHAEIFGNAEVEVVKYFSEKPQGENNVAIQSLSLMEVQDVLISPDLVDEHGEELVKWFKIKASLSAGEGSKAFNNLYLVQHLTMEEAQKKVIAHLSNTSYDVTFKTCTEIQLMEYIELPAPESSNEDSSFETGEDPMMRNVHGTPKIGDDVDDEDFEEDDFEEDDFEEAGVDADESEDDF